MTATTDEQLARVKILAFNLCGLPDEQREALAAVLSELTAARESAKARGYCGVCWTSSWTPVPADDPNAEQMPDGRYARCDMCYFTTALKEKNAELTVLRKLRDYVQQVSDSGDCGRCFEDALAECGKGGGEHE